MEENIDLNEQKAPASAKVVQEISSNDEDERIITNTEDLEKVGLSDIGLWIVEALKDSQPDTEITLGSVQVLSELLDNLTSRVIEEAKKISHGGEGPGDPEEQANAPKIKQALTSLDIHKALKKLLPGEPGDPLRPYLPAVTKQAWHLDKQSLKGIKRQKTAHAKASTNPSKT